MASLPFDPQTKKPPEGGFIASGEPAYFFWRYLRSAASCAAITASSDCAIAMSMSFLAFFSASSAAALAWFAFSSSSRLRAAFSWPSDFDQKMS